LKQDIKEGDRFNVLRSDKNIQFHLVIDTTRCKMWFYYVDLDKNEPILLKTYCVGLGRPDATKASGLLTPLGKYSLGEKIAIYKPKVMGYHNGEKVEMIQVFGTRWIPFEKEISKCTASPRGLGIHGIPWTPNGKEELTEDLNSLGKYESDGCIRLATKDMEELFAIIITKPTILELVRDFRDAQLLGKP
jgi:lipoprotein-anchoring transpeptidase ErfK/SrfK